MFLNSRRKTLSYVTRLGDCKDWSMNIAVNLRVLVGALNSTLENRVTLAAQKAAIDTAVRLLGDQSEKPTDDAPDQ